MDYMMQHLLIMKVLYNQLTCKKSWTKTRTAKTKVGFGSTFFKGCLKVGGDDRVTTISSNFSTI